MMRKRKHIDGVRQDAERAFGAHVMEEALSRSFVFRSHPVEKRVEQLREGAYPFAKHRVVEQASFRPTSHYWFRLTWTLGSLALVGDLGELTLVHHQALRTFDDIGWALSADHDYLMSKTGTQKVYDPDETLASVVGHLNEEALEALNGRRDRFATRDADGKLGWSVRRTDGFRQELQAWRRDLIEAEFRGDAMEDLPERPDDCPYTFTRKVGWEHEARYGLGKELHRFWHIPDHWTRWVKAWSVLRARSHYDIRFSHEHPDYVLLAKNRAQLKHELRDELESASEAADLLHRMGFDDFYGVYVWPAQSYWQIAAIQHGVRMILAGEAQAAGPVSAEAA